jgi:2-C-methyl-D-erythritol 4-phosphate cytidylyltransferase
MKEQVIIVAGGKGLRMGTDIPKQFLLLNGKPVLMHTIEAFYNYNPQIEIIVVLPSEQRAYWRRLREAHLFDIDHEVVSGGETRFHSVRNAMQLIEKGTLVAVHDGVRPLVTKEIIEKAFAAAVKKKGAFPAVPVVDAIRKKKHDGSKSVDRSCYYFVQTPQVFQSDLLIKGYRRRYSKKFTDDVSVVEASRKCKPVMIEGSIENIKITTPFDLVVAENILKLRL